MAKGDRADFFRSVRIGRRLRAAGWIPWGLSFETTASVDVDGLPCRLLRRVELGHTFCNTVLSLRPPTPGRPSPKSVRAALIAAGGRGEVTGPGEDGTLSLRRGFLNSDEIDRPPRRRRPPSRPMPHRRRARLILALLDRLGRGAWAPWRSCHLHFNRVWRVRGEGRTWCLSSALFFGAREGLYWNTVLWPPACDTRSEALALARLASADLRKLGFRVAKPCVSKERGKRSWGATVLFDQHFLPSARLLRKMKDLAAWRPTTGAGRRSP